MSRRGVLSRIALVGSAVTTSGLDYVLRPGSAYASVCGESHTCASAWTAMCCTVNNGVNQCPPGSFAGGWWKADGASLCGGKARYYVDCQGECTRCGCHGSSFCGEHCWNCKPHCAHGGTCDERRVCHNLFRYGQCERDRHCSGPVMCRAISCTPPWKWASCSTTAATDDFTVTHSAPCLPQWTAIQQRYTHLGSEGSVLGTTVHREVKTAHGHVQRYQHGRMYSSPATGARYLTGPVLHHYVALGESSSPLGLPTTDITDTANGHSARFQHGGIFQGPPHGPHAVWGAVWTKWLGTDLDEGPLGYPITDLTATADGTGRFTRFEHGAIYQGGGHAPHVLFGDTATTYRQLGYEKSPLGYPITDQHAVADADRNPGIETAFEHGAIDVTPGNPGRAVWGAIFTTWDGGGRAAGPLGFPISSVYQVDTADQRCDFAHGYAIWSQVTDDVTVTMT